MRPLREPRRRESASNLPHSGVVRTATNRCETQAFAVLRGLATVLMTTHPRGEQVRPEPTANGLRDSHRVVGQGWKEERPRSRELGSNHPCGISTSGRSTRLIREATRHSTPRRVERESPRWNALFEVPTAGSQYPKDPARVASIPYGREASSEGRLASARVECRWGQNRGSRVCGFRSWLEHGAGGIWLVPQGAVFGAVSALVDGRALRHRLPGLSRTESPLQTFFRGFRRPF